VTYFLGDEAYVQSLPGLGWWPSHADGEWWGNLMGGASSCRTSSEEWPPTSLAVD
jgi:hypothetical protein